MKTTKRTNTSFSTEEQTEIKNLMERGVSRKTAIRKLRANQKAATKLREKAEKNTPDLKSAAANDKVEFANPVDAPIVIKNPNAKKPKTVGQAVAKAVNKVEVGAARSEGIRLYKLAGRPTKQQFVAVYGPKGAKMTWDQRAAAGVPAEKFQETLQMAMALAAKTNQKNAPVLSTAPTANPTSVTTTGKRKGAARG